MFVKTILDLKGPDVITAQAEASVQDVARLFKAERIGFALVISGDGVKTIAGTVSERDIIQGMAVKGCDIATQPVSSIMTSNIVQVSSEETLDHVRDLMTSKRTRHVLVMDDGELMGVVSIGDLILHHLNECRVDSQVMRAYINGQGYH
jgi:CBS domain-containing protein